VFAAAKLDRFGVACHGGAERNDASPSSFRFYLTAAPGNDGVLSTRAMLSITVPESFDPEELCKRATELATDLRIRWGVAGFAYGGWELDRYGETRDAIFAHARRHPGYDMGQHATLMETWHHALRTVSWLTFVGPSLAKSLPQKPAADDLVSLSAIGECICLRAGKAPARGDVNRGDFPPAYARVDAALRSLRASTGVHFMTPWSEKTSLAWLRRFEPER
jgi:hypothetical protein